jgi:intracellular sulfur oxidation DsrE/DsrF family protein
MKRYWILAAAALVLFAGTLRPAHAQTPLIPGVEPATDFPNERELPNPNTVYKVAFDIGKDAPKVDEVYPGLEKITEYYNTLAKHGVAADHIKFVVVFHQKGGELALTNAVYKVRHDGHDNASIPLIHNMKKAGIDFRVCGQGVLGMKVEQSAVQPDIQIDLWALVTLVNLSEQGYARVSGF